MSMQAILAASNSMVKMQTMQSVNKQIQGQSGVLRSESKQDGGNAAKDAQADELDKKSNLLMGDLMGEMTEVNETLKPDEEDKAEADAKADAKETEKQPKTDTLTLSDSAAKHLGEESSVKAVAGEAVTYKPDGSAASSTLAESASAFQATA